MDAPKPKPQVITNSARCHISELKANISVPTNWNSSATAITWRLSRRSPTKPQPKRPATLNSDTPKIATPAISRLIPKLAMAGIWCMDADMTRPDMPIAIASCQNTRLVSACRVVKLTSFKSADLRLAAVPVASAWAAGCGAPSGSMPYSSGRLFIVRDTGMPTTR